MKKLLTLVLLGLIITSCSKDDTQIEQTADSKLAVVSDNDFLSQGTYKGAFVTLGSSQRGKVLVQIDELEALATITLSDMSQISFTATRGISTETGAEEYRFVSEKGSFNFSVNADGTNPIVSATEINGLAGNIVIAKDLVITPVRIVTGTFGCNECDEHPVLTDPNMQDTFVWNLIFISGGVESGIVKSQVSFGDNIFVTAGSIDNPYNKLSSLIYNEMNGEFPFGAEGLIGWEATQLYDMEVRCADIVGTWNLRSPAYNIEGWIRNDDSCNGG